MMRMGCVAALALALTGCGGGGSDYADEVVKAPSDLPEIATLREQGTTGDYAFTIPAKLDPSTLTGIAKEQCGRRSHCSVFGWTERSQMARALPLTEPEVATIAFRYDLNRTSGMERSLFDCAKFPQPDKANCL